MRVGELLGQRPARVVTVEPDTRVAGAIRMMLDHNVGALPVMKGGRLLGIIAERDVVETLGREHGDVRGIEVARIMRRAPTCNANDDVRDLMARMTGERLRHFVVVDGEELRGIISVGDIVKRRLEELEVETGVLRDYVAGQRAM